MENLLNQLLNFDPKTVGLVGAGILLLFPNLAAKLKGLLPLPGPTPAPTPDEKPFNLQERIDELNSVPNISDAKKWGYLVAGTSLRDILIDELKKRTT